MVFVVRLNTDESGRVTGVVERVKTGEKQRVDDMKSIGDVIARMVATSESREPAIGESPAKGDRG